MAGERWALAFDGEGYAAAASSSLDDFALSGDLSLEAWAHPKERAVAVADLVTHRSARGGYSLRLDPVGSMSFHRAKPTTWCRIDYCEGFPATELTLELSYCPLRGGSRSTLVSYAASEGTEFRDLTLYEGRAGLTLELNGQRLETGIFQDYSQWQHLAVTWRSADGEVAVFRDDRDHTIEATLPKARAPELGEPIFRGSLARGEALRGGGVLVFGQAQERPGDTAAFDLDRSFVGALRNLRLWDHARGRRELEEHRGSWLAGSEPGLVLDLRFSQLAYQAAEGIDAAGRQRPQLGGTVVGRSVRDVREYRLVAAVGARAAASRALLPAGCRAHVAATFRSAPGGRGAGEELRLFLDGLPARSEPLCPSLLFTDERQHFRIGGMGRGELSNVRLWRAVRSPGQILEGLEGVDPAAEPDLLALYTGETAPDGRLWDGTGGGRDLLLHGAARSRAVGVSRRRSAGVVSV